MFGKKTKIVYIQSENYRIKQRANDATLGLFPRNLNSSPLKCCHPKKGIQPSFFRGELLSFGGIFFSHGTPCDGRLVIRGLGTKILF